MNKMDDLDIERVRCPDCGSEHFSIKYVPSAGTYYFICLACQMDSRSPPHKFLSTELIDVSAKSKSKRLLHE